MTLRHPKRSLLKLVGAGCVALLCCIVAPAQAAVYHELTIQLDLGGGLLTGIDRLRLTPPDGLEPLIFSLSGRARIQTVRLDGRPVPYHFDTDADRLRIDTAADWREHLLEIHYSCRFDDPLPESTLNTDNPGYGVNGTISSNGVFILAGARWYPQSAGDRSIRLAVEAPRGFPAVTSGDLIEHRDLPQSTLSRWHCEPVVEALSLVAGPFVHRVLPLDRIGATATYFTAQRDYLSPTYLTAAAGYLRLYQDLFGAYAFNQFAVVENFFPTGYGFPGFSVIGGRVLELPFIPQTSLGHEIAHCWWGNGVLVDGRQGNWAEGLTTYVAEHLYLERASVEQAAAQRREWLRNYAALVPAERDMALADFTSRSDPVTKTIGYDKAAMLFHMLRRTVGDEAFWETLREIYAQRRFRKTAWSDLLAAFEAHSGMALDAFFTQWIGRAGAPRLTLDRVESLQTTEGWVVRGQIRQTEPVYALDVPLQLIDSGATTPRTVRLDGLHADFEFQSKAPPLRLTADPHADLFRRLAPEELPTTINALRGAARLTFAVAPRTGTAGRDAAHILQTALAPDAAETAAGEIDPWSTAGALVIIGPPADRERWNAAFPALTITADHFVLDGRSYALGRFGFFGVFTLDGRTVGIYLPSGDPPTVRSVAAKVSHYGNYSYLLFESAHNQLKGVWPAADSPLQITWPKAGTTREIPSVRDR